MITCPWCSGGPAMLLGVLGRLAHFRCQGCGGDFSLPASEIETETETCG